MRIASGDVNGAIAQFERALACPGIDDRPLVRGIAAIELADALASADRRDQAIEEASAALEPATLALMHGSSFRGDGRGALETLADAYDARLLRLPVGADR